MNRLLLPCIFNIIVLIPVGLLTLFGGEKGGQIACQSKFAESEGFRTILGSLWTAILIGSGMGMFFPATMSPLLMRRSKHFWVRPKTLSGISTALPRLPNSMAMKLGIWWRRWLKLRGKGKGAESCGFSPNTASIRQSVPDKAMANATNRSILTASWFVPECKPISKP